MIEVNNLTTERINKVFLKRIAEKVLTAEKKRRTKISLALIEEKEIKKINRKYRRKNRPTDVLSFDYDNLKEIVICPVAVRKNAKRYNSTLKKELARVLIHGILHLLGYEHEKNKKKAEIMGKKEEEYLKLCQKII